jgi:MbtH protein
MSDDEDIEQKCNYKVVVNDEDQYSIWWANRENAPGWKDVGRTGTKGECLDYIEQVWTDMRPMSLRQKLAATEKEKEKEKEKDDE